MPLMVRHIAAIGIVLSLVGCASRHERAKAPPAIEVVFSNEEQKILACLDLQDHIVDLYTSEYVQREGLTMSAVERTAFRDGWAEELARRGTFERFEQSCVSSLTPRKYQCGMASTSTGSLVACMKMALADVPNKTE
jgi:hypothetical protein